MGRLSRRAWTALSLAGVCIALALVVWAELSVVPRAAIPETPATVAATEQQADEPEAMTFSFTRLQDYEEIVRRPLFNATRKPDETEQAETSPDVRQAPMGEAQSLVVLGIVISPEMTMAVVQDKKTKKIVKAALGTTIHGWEVTEIREDGITIRLKDREAKLKLYKPADKKKAVPKRKPRRRPGGGLADAQPGR